MYTLILFNAFIWLQQINSQAIWILLCCFNIFFSSLFSIRRWNYLLVSNEKHTTTAGKKKDISWEYEYWHYCGWFWHRWRYVFNRIVTNIENITLTTFIRKSWKNKKPKLIKKGERVRKKTSKFVTSLSNEKCPVWKPPDINTFMNVFFGMACRQ